MSNGINESSLNGHTQLFDLLSECCESYGLFDSKDILIWANQAFLTTMYLSSDDIGQIDYLNIVRKNYDSDRGFMVSCGNVDEFIRYIQLVRRVQKHHIFEIDYQDGRWFIVSEQTDSGGYLLMHLTEITTQKNHLHSVESFLGQYRELALTDELTSLPNRRGFLNAVNDELSALKQEEAQVSLLIADIDYFKCINDHYGHQCGDETLRLVATLMRQALRPLDLIGRIGGEEFAIFLADSSDEIAFEIAERVRKQVNMHEFKWHGFSYHITISIGYVTTDEKIGFESLYEKADQSLYIAKNSGRDQVIGNLPELSLNPIHERQSSMTEESVHHLYIQGKK